MRLPTLLVAITYYFIVWLYYAFLLTPIRARHVNNSLVKIYFEDVIRTVRLSLLNPEEIILVVNVVVHVFNCLYLLLGIYYLRDLKSLDFVGSLEILCVYLGQYQSPVSCFDKQKLVGVAFQYLDVRYPIYIYVGGP